MASPWIVHRPAEDTAPSRGPTSTLSTSAGHRAGHRSLALAGCRTRQWPALSRRAQVLWGPEPPVSPGQVPASGPLAIPPTASQMHKALGTTWGHWELKRHGGHGGWSRKVSTHRPPWLAASARHPKDRMRLTEPGRTGQLLSVGATQTDTRLSTHTKPGQDMDGICKPCTLNLGGPGSASCLSSLRWQAKPSAQRARGRENPRQPSKPGQ